LWPGKCRLHASLEIIRTKTAIPRAQEEMPGKSASLAVLFLSLCLFASFASAQEEKNELTGSIGRIFISDQGVHGPDAPSADPFVRSGKGFTFEVGYARLLRTDHVYSLSLEVPAVFNLDEDLGSGGNVVPTGYQQIFVTPAARLNLFPATRVSPWVSLGGGFAHFTEDKNLIYYGSNPGGSSTSAVLEGGFGLDVALGKTGRVRRLSLRGEVRDFWSGTPNLPLADTGKTRQHNYFVGGGVIWHF
jgi:hypothetical protein